MPVVPDNDPEVFDAGARELKKLPISIASCFTRVHARPASYDAVRARRPHVTRSLYWVKRTHVRVTAALVAGLCVHGADAGFPCARQQRR